MIFDFHPLVIHFPIALFSAAIFFDLLYLIFNNDDFKTGGWWTMLFALVSSSAAIATGIIDDTFVGHLGTVFPIWLNHGWVQFFSCITKNLCPHFFRASLTPEYNEKVF